MIKPKNQTETKQTPKKKETDDFSLPKKQARCHWLQQAKTDSIHSKP